MAASPSSRRTADEPDASITSLYKPKLVVAYGRGGSGKSTGIRYIVERAQAAGRDLVIADADPRATLGNYFTEVMKPTHSEEVVVTDWLDALAPIRFS